MASEIAINSAAAAALRQTVRQLNELNAQMRGAVNVLALALDVPPGWQFDAERMAFVPPAETPAAAEAADA